MVFYDNPDRILSEALEAVREASVRVSNLASNEYGYKGLRGNALRKIQEQLYAARQEYYKLLIAEGEEHLKSRLKK